MWNNILIRGARKIGTYLCAYRGYSFADKIEQITDSFHRKLNNVNFDIEKNGELRLLKLISTIKPNCFFDVGANIGDWTLCVSSLYPESIVHAFEIVPSTFNEFAKNTEKIKKYVKANNFGLSDHNGNVLISLGEGTSMSTGCKIEAMEEHHKYYTNDIKCAVKKASSYLEKENVCAIDFLKIDVEGMELKVLKGFEDKIKLARVVQFEYGIFNIGSHDLLADFCKFFKDNGFAVGKIFPNYVNFFKYHFDMENFHGSNFLAVRKDEKELISKLSKR
jgi:FkbM family methyltransferase